MTGAAEAYEAIFGEAPPGNVAPLRPRKLTIDANHIGRFVDLLFRHASPDTYVSLRGFYDNRDGPPWVIEGVLKNEDLPQAAARIAQRCADADEPVVFCPPVATFKTARRATEANLAEGLDLSVELDNEPDAGRAKLEALLGPGTVVVASGGEWRRPDGSDVLPKLHLHWRLQVPTRDDEAHAKLKAARKLATKIAGGDASNSPLVHPIRWPGSWHRKAAPRPCRIIAANPDIEIDLDDALRILKEVAGETVATDAPPAGTDDSSIELSSLSDDLQQTIIDGPDGENGSAVFYRVVKALTELNHSPAAIHDLLIEYPAVVPERYADRLLQEILRVVSKPSNRVDPKDEFTAWTETPAMAAWIAEINAHHATVVEFGKPVVYVFRPTGGRHSKIERMSYDDFARIGEHDVVKVGNKVVPRNLAWRRDPLHRHYREVVFEPGRTVPAGTLNLWQDWPVDPMPGDWSLMQAHIRDVICEGDPVRYDYAVRWLAWKVQHPGGRPEVPFTIHGSKGTGKGRFAYWYGRLFGEHRVTAKHRDEVLGRFNGHLHHCAPLIAEEAFFARDPTVDGPLKVMITEPDYRVEYKFGASVSVPNKLAIMMLSNHDSVVPATADERRYFVTRVSSARIRDFAYFDALDRQMESGGLAAMLHDLLAMDLTKFKIRDVPNTAALKEQKRHAAKGAEAWLWDVLEEGRIPGDFGADWTDDGLEIPKDRLYKAYRESDKPHPLADSVFGRKLVEILGDSVTATRPMRDKARVNLWQFAPLPTCRATFEAHMNVAGYRWPKC